MIKWVKRFLILFFAVIVILSGILFVWYKTADEDTRVDLLTTLITPGNVFNDILEWYAVKVRWGSRILYSDITGDYEREKIAYNGAIIAYEMFRYIYGTLGIHSDEIPKWFEQKIPFYKKAILFNLNDKKGGDQSLAFLYADLCKGRTLTDRYSETMFSRYKYYFNGYQAEKNTLADYERKKTDLILKINTNEDVDKSKEEYLKLQKKEQYYRRNIRANYSNVMIP